MVSNIVQEEILPLRYISTFTGNLGEPLFNHAIEHQKVKLANWLMDRGADLNFGEEMDYFRPLELAVMHWFYGDDYAFLSYNDSINERGMLLMKMIDKGARFSEENRYDFLDSMIRDDIEAGQTYNVRLFSFICSYQIYKGVLRAEDIHSQLKEVWENNPVVRHPYHNGTIIDTSDYSNVFDDPSAMKYYNNYFMNSAQPVLVDA